jgi:hypothetical protein
MEDDLAKKRAAEKQHDPIAIERGAFGGAGDVVEGSNSMTEPQGDGLETVPEQDEDFARARGTHVLEILGQPCIDMINLNVVWIGRWGASGGAHIATKALNQIGNHLALAMVWRRGVCEHE